MKKLTLSQSRYLKACSMFGHQKQPRVRDLESFAKHGIFDVC